MSLLAQKSFNLGLCQFPAVELNVEDNRKRGRPGKVKSALMRDRGLEYPTQLVTQTVMPQVIETTQAVEVIQADEVNQVVEVTQAVAVTQAISTQASVPLVPRKRGRPPKIPK